MTSRAEAYTAALDRASVHARSWLASMPDRTVPPQRNGNEIVIHLGGPLPEGPTPAADVIDLLAEGVGPGLMAMPSDGSSAGSSAAQCPPRWPRTG
jgi:hypothetical protein